MVLSCCKGKQTDSQRSERSLDDDDEELEGIWQAALEGAQHTKQPDAVRTADLSSLVRCLSSKGSGHGRGRFAVVTIRSGINSASSCGSDIPTSGALPICPVLLVHRQGVHAVGFEHRR